MTSMVQDSGRIAAFFDVDGTLLSAPSLEVRFFAALRSRRAIPARNYLLWIACAVQLAPHGIAGICHTNKMYLRGVRTDCRNLLADSGSRQTHTLRVFPDALARVAWHAAQGHAIVLVTGTLAPLAHQIALALTLDLASRGLPAAIGVCATRLEESQGRWTGRILGPAIFGVAKAHAARQIASAESFDLPRCYAYGDNANDRWLLAAVGRPAAVNPSPDLRRVALLYDWPVLLWTQEARPLGRNIGSGYAAVSPTSETLG
jgi:HAD superfamily hydrolase (TIGR01490 family)